MAPFTRDICFERISPPVLVIFEDGVVIFSAITGDHYLNDALHKTSFISKSQVAPCYRTVAMHDHKCMKEEIRI